MASIEYTAVNYVLWAIGMGTIGFFIIALLAIYLKHRQQSQAKKRQQLLSRRRKGMQYVRPTDRNFEVIVEAP
jgi:membrane protein implicated in regulation of membrane protease activity